LTHGEVQLLRSGPRGFHSTGEDRHWKEAMPENTKPDVRRERFDVFSFSLIFEKKRLYMKSSDAQAPKCHLKFSSRMIIFIKLVYLSSVISLI